MTFKSKNIFVEIVKDLSTYSKRDIIVLAKKWSIPFVNKSQAINVISYKIFTDNFQTIGRLIPFLNIHSWTWTATLQLPNKQVLIC